MIDKISQSALGTMSPEASKLQRAVRDFEAMLIVDLLKSAPRGNIDGGEDKSGVEGYDDVRTEAMASALAANGGIGVARMLLKTFGPVTDKLQIKGFSSNADPVIAGRSKEVSP